MSFYGFHIHRRSLVHSLTWFHRIKLCYPTISLSFPLPLPLPLRPFTPLPLPPRRSPAPNALRQLRDLSPILPQHAHIPLPPHHPLPILRWHQPLRIALCQHDAIIRNPPLRLAIRQRPRNIDVDQQLGIVAHPADDVGSRVLGQPRRAVDVVAAHGLQAAGLQDGGVEGVVGAVDDGGGHVARLEGQGREEGGGGEGDAVALVGADEVVRWVGGGGGRGDDGRVEF